MWRHLCSTSPLLTLIMVENDMGMVMTEEAMIMIQSILYD